MSTLHVIRQFVLPVEPLLPFIWTTFDPAIESAGIGVVFLGMTLDVRMAIEGKTADPALVRLNSGVPRVHSCRPWRI